MKKIKKNEQGSVLLATLLIIVILSLLGWAFIYTTITLSAQSQKTALSKQAYYFADAGIERTTNRLWNDFVNIGMVPNKMSSFESIVQDAEDDYDATTAYFIEEPSAGDKNYQVFIRVVPDLTDNRQVTVEITSTGYGYLDNAEDEFVTRTIVSQVRYYLIGTQLMDFAYFANNFAWHTGSIHNGGSMGTNGWASLQGPRIGPGDRWADCIKSGGNYDLINKIDDGGIYAPMGFDKESYNDYADVHPLHAEQHDALGHDGDYGTDAFEGLEMPSLASSDFYGSFVKDMEADALLEGEKYGIYTWVPQNTNLYANDGVTVIGTVSTVGGDYIKASDAVFGDDLTGADSNTGYYFQNGKWIKGEKENIVLSSDATHPLKVYGTVVVEENVVMANNYIDGVGAIFAGYNIYAAGTIQYKDKPTNSTGGVATTLQGYRGFTNANDGDNNDPDGGSGYSSLAGAEANQEDWLEDNQPASADVANGKDLLGLFANESICVGDMGTASDRNNLSTALNQPGNIDVSTGSGTVHENVNFSESDEAKLGVDQIPNTRTSLVTDPNTGEYIDDEYGYEQNGKWDVLFYTPENPPPTGATNPGTGNPMVPWDGDPATLSDDYASWPQEAKDAVIPGSGEDIDGDGFYDDSIDVYDAVAFNPEDAADLRNGSHSDPAWTAKLTFNSSSWGGNVDITQAANNTLEEVSNNVGRLDALTYTNHVWGGKIYGPANGTLLTRIESTYVSSTTGCPINHDDRIAGGGASIMDLNFITPLTEAMSVSSWRE